MEQGAMWHEIILVTTVDIDPAAEAPFNRWYNDKHLPEVLACPGFVSAARYECVAGQPRYMAIYHLESEQALTTPEMKKIRGWGDMFPYVKNFHERIYRKRFESSSLNKRG
jgi:hypothetical protein